MPNEFTATASWRFGGPNGKSFVKKIGTLIIDTTALGGATAGDLPASMFDLQTITQGGFVTLANNTRTYVSVPAYNQASLLVTGGASNAPMDLPNGTYLIEITGQ